MGVKSIFKDWIREIYSVVYKFYFIKLFFKVYFVIFRLSSFNFKNSFKTDLSRAKISRF